LADLLEWMLSRTFRVSRRFYLR